MSKQCGQVIPGTSLRNTLENRPFAIFVTSMQCSQYYQIDPYLPRRKLDKTAKILILELFMLEIHLTYLKMICTGRSKYGGTITAIRHLALTPVRKLRTNLCTPRTAISAVQIFIRPCLHVLHDIAHKCGEISTRVQPSGRTSHETVGVFLVERVENDENFAGHCVAPDRVVEKMVFGDREFGEELLGSVLYGDKIVAHFGQRIKPWVSV